MWIILDPAFDPAQPAADRYVRGDRRRLQQVLINLLSNVIKYNRANGRIDVGVVLADDTHLGVAVTDTGKGIAADDLPRLFQPFDRLRAAILRHRGHRNRTRAFPPGSPP